MNTSEQCCTFDYPKMPLFLMYSSSNSILSLPYFAYNGVQCFYWFLYELGYALDRFEWPTIFSLAQADFPPYKSADNLLAKWHPIHSKYCVRLHWAIYAHPKSVWLLQWHPFVSIYMPSDAFNCNDNRCRSKLKWHLQIELIFFY